MGLIKNLLLVSGPSLSTSWRPASKSMVSSLTTRRKCMAVGCNSTVPGPATKSHSRSTSPGLHLGKTAGTPDEVLNQPSSKCLSITMMRDIDAADLGKLLTRGMEDNIGRSEMSQLIPCTGSVVTVKGKAQCESFKRPEFFKALMSIRLGPVPADWKLKDALLGVK